MNKKNKSLKGFTLIELMIVVAIIGILAAIAIPNFIRYQLRSKTAEAKTNIGAIKTNMESFRAGYDIYPSLMPTPAAYLPGQKTDWNGPACAGCDRQNLGNCTEFSCVGYEPSGQVYYSYSTAGTAPGVIPDFAIDAQGDLDIQGLPGEFCYQSSNDTAVALGVVACPVVGQCAAALPAGEVVNCNEFAF